MKKFLKTSLILLVTLTVIIACSDENSEGNSEGNPVEKKAVLSLDKESLAFGEITQENSTNLEFVISNKGDGTLKITSVEIEGTNNDQFSTSLTAKDIEADKDETFTVTFQPNMYGDKVAELKFVTNVGTKTISLTGTAKVADDNILDLADGLKQWCIATSKDSNNDGEIQYSEVKDVTYVGINAGVYNLKSLKGLEMIDKLEFLYLIDGSDIKTIDLFKYINLEKLYLLRTEGITTLDFTKNVKLKDVNIKLVPTLETIDVSTCTELKFFNVIQSPLKTLDCSKNTALEGIQLFDTSLESLDLSNNIELTYIAVINENTDGLLTSLNLKNLTKLSGGVFIKGHKNLACVSVDAGVDITTSDWNFNGSGVSTAEGKVVVCD